MQPTGLLDVAVNTHIGVLEDAAEYDIDSLKKHAASDSVLLREWADKARSVTRDADPTLAALCEELAAIAIQHTQSAQRRHPPTAL